ncbi:MAG: TIM barrel protein, partial [Desulfobacterales bacterium]|nr:TIM barrel protein [Desulfobacterales bacterium]
MKFSQSSAVYFNHSLKYAIQNLHDLGYKGIEIWGGRPHMYRCDLEEQMEEITTLLKNLNMGVCNFIPAQFRYPSILCSSNETVRRESVVYIKTAKDNALKVASPSISLCPGMRLWDEGDLSKGWALLKKSFQEIDEYNHDLNLFILIEPAHKYESNLILEFEDCLRMLEEIKSDKFGILLDVGHVNVNGEQLSNILPKCKSLPLHIHLNDNNGDFDSHLIPGKGNIDFKTIFSQLMSIDYQGFVSVE